MGHFKDITYKIRVKFQIHIIYTTLGNTLAVIQQKTLRTV